MKSKNQLLIRPLFISSFLISSLFTIANDIKVRSITELTSDLLARTSARTDKNGKDCAIVRVNIPTIKTMSFQNVEDDNVSYQAGEYLLYVSEGTEEIPYSVDGYKPGLIKFSDYDIRVTSKKVYRVTLNIETNQSWLSTDGATLSITTEPESAVVLIDGIPVGASPIIIPGISKGKHVISFPKIRYGEEWEGEEYGLSDQVIEIQKNESIEKHFKLTKYENTDNEASDDNKSMEGSLIEEVVAVEEESEDDSLNMYWSYDNGTWRIPMTGSDNDGEGYYPLKYIKFESNGKQGLKDYWGNVVVPCEYDYVDEDSSGDCFVVWKRVNGEWKKGLYQPDKGLVTPCIYKAIWYSDPGVPLIEVVNDGRKSGFINREGKEVIRCVFNLGRPYTMRDKYNFFIRGIEQKGYVILNQEGKPIHDKFLREFIGFWEGYAIAKDFEGNMFLVDSMGVFHSGIFDKIDKNVNIQSYSEGLIVCGSDYWGRGAINIEGKEIIPLSEDYYDYNHLIFEAENGWVTFGIKHCDSVIIADKNGNTYNCSKNDYHEPINHYLPFVKNKNIGLYDQNGKVRLPFVYDDIYGKGNYIIAKKGTFLSIYDHSLNKLFEFENSGSVEIKAINDGIVLLYDKASGKYGYMNLKGELLAGCFYDMEEMEYLYLNRLEREDYLCIKNGMAIVNIGDRYGIIDKDGNFVIPMIYRMIIPFYDGTMYARTTDGTWIVLDVEKTKIKNK